MDDESEEQPGAAAAVEHAQEEEAAPPPGNARLLAEVFERWTTRGKVGPPKLPRRQARFLVDATTCTPGVFPEDFWLTIRGITSRSELEAAKAAGGEPVALAFEMARASLYAVNDVPLDVGKGQDVWLWNVLDTGGRQLVVAQFMALTGLTPEAQGKARRWLTIS
jgi:hypothetical protein